MPVKLYVRSFGILVFLGSIVFTLAMAATFLLSVYFKEIIPPSMIVLLPIIVALLIVGFHYVSGLKKGLVQMTP